MPHFTGNIPIDSRLYLSSAASHIRPRACKAIYISREQGRHRLILNEEELLEGLSTIMSLDFMRLELLSIPDQISLMKGAEVVVAPHGAGLSWLAFNSSPCHLFEIFSSDYVNNCFEGVCAHGSLHERYIEPNTRQESGFVVSVGNLVRSFADFVERIADYE